MADAAAQKPILIVEDKDNIRNLLSINLKARGYKTHCVGSAEEALTVLSEQVPGLMLLDISLPGMTGWELLSVIEEKALNTNLPVVVITGTPPTAQETKQHTNVVDVIVKPILIERFISAVEQALNG